MFMIFKEHSQFFKKYTHYEHLTYTFFKDYTQFCTFNVHNFSKNVGNFIQLTYTIFK